ncbi:hypothetical protein J8M20_10560 [Pseudoalteromonas luteoviolacea]|uniref:hypothetical protein n=1 Tax=Pseudoalteromonas luteoviolacea TaxID=43657 RepID=UPI001B379616|nr:hypothetical protein [Pseudoalteromonas luteoviolacea]MBQ4811781.1 hypothetical protein [Pseudoalteromonas luteoviolacea]
MQALDTKIEFFISQLSIGEKKDEIYSKLYQFFKGEDPQKHVIYKRSIIYFYYGSDIVETYSCTPVEVEHSISFDGSKVSKIEKSYFTGSSSKSIFDVEFEMSSNNNNNNNNNNNGNNNG